MDMDIKLFFAWIWMDMDLLNFLSMDMDGYGFYKPHPCQSLLETASEPGWRHGLTGASKYVNGSPQSWGALEAGERFGTRGGGGAQNL